jgi:hypothetical protein
MTYLAKHRSLGNAAPALALVLLLAAMAPAAAQISGGGGHGQRGQQQTPQQSPTPTPTIPNVPEPWPRLEGGALLCKSRDGLVKYQTDIGKGTGVIAAQLDTDCHSIRKQTGIQILDRDGPSRTQVVTTDDAKETGWTNTYLPDTPPN